MYANSASTGDAQNDFNNKWKELVVTPYKAEANPETETQTTEDGWKAVTGAALVKSDNNDVYIILTVLSGFGKTVSIRSSLNDQSYTAYVDALFETMELDKTKTSTVNNNNIATEPAGAAGKFGLMTYTAAAGWSEQKFQDGIVFKPLDIPAGEHLAIQIMQPLNISGSLEQALAQSFEEATTMYNGTSMYQSGGKYSKNASSKSYNGWEYIRGKGGIRVQDGTQHGTTSHHRRVASQGQDAWSLPRVEVPSGGQLRAHPRLAGVGCLCTQGDQGEGLGSPGRRRGKRLHALLRRPQREEEAGGAPQVGAERRVGSAAGDRPGPRGRIDHPLCW